MMRTLLRHLPPAASVVLALIFCFANPYASQKPSGSTITIIFGSLILPAVLVSASIWLRSKKLKYAGFFLSLPCSLYLGLASIPSYWTLFIVIAALYPFIPTKD